MAQLQVVRKPRQEAAPLRLIADQTFSRVAGAPLIAGNAVRLLKDAGENYPAWLDAIRSAKHRILMESYIIFDDAEGRRFAQALIEKANEGVQVFLIYDWIGAFPQILGRFWKRLRAGGVQVRCFNPPNLTQPLGWMTRNHRKSLVIDNRFAFVSGLCIGCPWAGDPENGVEPWRDTGIEISGPAVAEVAHGFSRSWEATGASLPPEILEIDHQHLNEKGDVDVRVIATEPETAGMFRLDQLIAAMARSRLWLSDAYFTGTTLYVQALVAAARDGVDVRLLLPGSSDIAIVSPVSRVAYRPLLEGGVRIFEWNGPMMHAKTAVADGRWARIGSTNLNLMSWTGNWELDVAVENQSFAESMEQMFLDDLNNATEIVMKQRRMVRQTLEGETPHHKRRRASARRVVTGALSLGRAVDAAVTNRRDFSRTEAGALFTASLFFVGFALLLYFFPKVITIPLAVFLGWISLSLIARAVRLVRKKHPGEPDKTRAKEPV